MFFDSGLANTVSAIRVGYAARHSSVIVPASRYLTKVLECLVSVGAVESISIRVNQLKQSTVHINLSYIKGTPAISSILLVSKKSNRCYIGARNLRRYLATRRGTAILSTSSGILSGSGACTRGVGGELLLWISY